MTQRTSMNRSMVASVGRYVMRNFMFLYSISAGSGLRTFIAFDDEDVAADVIASAPTNSRRWHLADKKLRQNRCRRGTMLNRPMNCWRHWETSWASCELLKLIRVCVSVWEGGTVSLQTGTRRSAVIYIVHTCVWLHDWRLPQTAPTRDGTARLDFTRQQQPHSSDQELWWYVL